MFRKYDNLFDSIMDAGVLTIVVNGAVWACIGTYLLITAVI